MVKQSAELQCIMGAGIPPDALTHLGDLDGARMRDSVIPASFSLSFCQEVGEREREKSWQWLQRKQETSRLFGQDPALGNFSYFCFIGPVGSSQISFPHHGASLIFLSLERVEGGGSGLFLYTSALLQ